MNSADLNILHTTIYDVEERRTSAMVDRDIDALSILIDDECRYVHSTGVVDTKIGYLEKLKSHAVGYSWIRSTDQAIIVFGAGFAVTHQMEAELILSGVARPYRSRAVALWRETPEGLRLAYFQATSLQQS